MCVLVCDERGAYYRIYDSLNIKLWLLLDLKYFFMCASREKKLFSYAYQLNFIVKIAKDRRVCHWKRALSVLPLSSYYSCPLIVRTEERNKNEEIKKVFMLLWLNYERFRKRRKKFIESWWLTIMSRNSRSSFMFKIQLS